MKSRLHSVLFFVLTFVSLAQSEIDLRKLHAERYQMRDEWFGAAEEIVQKTKDKEAREVLEFMKSHSILSIPIPTGVYTLEDSSEGFFLVPLLHGDERVSQLWRDIVSASPLAGPNIHMEDHMVILRDTSELSRLWKGIYFLHEMHHVREAAHGKGKIGHEEEREATEFQNRLMILVGGRRYQLLLDREVKRLGQSHGPEPGPYNPVLDEILGMAKSHTERILRQKYLWIHAHFVMFEKKYPKGSKAAKTEFLKLLEEKERGK